MDHARGVENPEKVITSIKIIKFNPIDSKKRKKIWNYDGISYRTNNYVIEAILD